MGLIRSSRKSKLARRAELVIYAVLAAYLALLIRPDIAFAYSYEHRQVKVASDRPIDPAIETRIDTALSLIQRSELYDPDQKFNIYISNHPWRHTLFTRNPKVGGQVVGQLSQNIFIRESDIAANKIIPPSGTLADMENRPLTYYFAHEMTHAMQARRDRFMRHKTPSYVMEGYADYIGKGDGFDFDEAITRLRSGHEFYAPGSRLYARQHLYVAHLIEREAMSFVEILDDAPDMETVLEGLE